MLHNLGWSVIILERFLIVRRRLCALFMRLAAPFMNKNAPCPFCLIMITFELDLMRGSDYIASRQTETTIRQSLQLRQGSYRIFLSQHTY